MIRLWLEKPDPANVNAYLQAISRDETGRATRIRAETERLRWLASRSLVRRAAAQMGVALPDELPRRCPACGLPTHGPPQFGSGLHVSVARRNSLVGVSVSTQPVGLDIEDLGAVVPSSSAVFSEHELWWLASARPEDAVWAWSAKEAVGKLTGLGLRDAHLLRVPLHATDGWSEATDATSGLRAVRRVSVNSPHMVTLAASEPTNVDVAP